MCRHISVNVSSKGIILVVSICIQVIIWIYLLNLSLILKILEVCEQLPVDSGPIPADS